MNLENCAQKGTADGVDGSSWLGTTLHATPTVLAAAFVCWRPKGSVGQARCGACQIHVAGVCICWAAGADFGPGIGVSLRG